MARTKLSKLELIPFVGLVFTAVKFINGSETNADILKNSKIGRRLNIAYLGLQYIGVMGAGLYFKTNGFTENINYPPTAGAW